MNENIAVVLQKDKRLTDIVEAIVDNSEYKYDESGNVGYLNTPSGYFQVQYSPGRIIKGFSYTNNYHYDFASGQVSAIDSQIINPMNIIVTCSLSTYINNDLTFTKCIRDDVMHMEDIFCLDKSHRKFTFTKRVASPLGNSYEQVFNFDTKTSEPHIDMLLKNIDAMDSGLCENYIKDMPITHKFMIFRSHRGFYTGIDKFACINFLHDCTRELGIKFMDNTDGDRVSK